MGEPQVQGHGDTVAKHYNQLEAASRAERTESRIYYLRNFNNWTKSVLIGETLQCLKRERGHGRDLNVLDMCSGKGGDLLKWKKGDISRLVCVDIAGTSVDQSESRYKEMEERERFRDRLFTAEFLTADCSKTRLKDMYKDPNMEFDLCSCQFSFHYCFESFNQVEVMLRNAVECLKLGGYFVGTTPNSQELVKRLREAEGMTFGNDVYSVTYEMESKDDIPLFGARYNFHLEGVVDCPEFIVFFPVLEKMAEKYGMKLVERKTFSDYFHKHVHNRDHKNLLGRMQALEVYPPDQCKLMGDPETEYEHAKSFVEKLKQSETDEERQNRRRPISIGTLSKSEWESATLYCVFAFQKVKDMQTGETWTSSENTQNPEPSRKRRSEGADRHENPEPSRKRRSEGAEGHDDCGPPKVLKT